MALTKVIGAGLGTLTEDQVLGGATPTLTIGDAGAEDAKIVFDGNAQDYHIGLDDSIDSLTIGKGSALGTTTSMVIDANGVITKPLQPAFFAYGGSNSWNSNVSNNTTIVLGSTKYNIGGHYNTSNGNFTAPVNGVYSFQANFYVKEGSGTALLKACLNDTPINHTNSAYPLISAYVQDGDDNDETIALAWSYYMTASQTMSLESGDAGTDYFQSMSYFSGYLAA